MIHLFLNQARYDLTGMADGGVGGGGGMWNNFGGDDWMRDVAISQEAVPAAESAEEVALQIDSGFTAGLQIRMGLYKRHVRRNRLHPA